MKNTPFTKKHIALGAKMVPFAGYIMPISYTSINTEHMDVRNAAGVFDVSHMGEFLLKGDKALDLIQKLTTNDASKLTDGKVQYSCLTNEEGGIIDDLLVYCLQQGKEYMLVVNASNIVKDWNWINKHNTDGVLFENISDQTCLLAIQGPKVAEMIQPLVDIDLKTLSYYSFAKGSFAGVKDVIISATGYTGAGGFEIYFPDENNNASIIWDAIAAAGIPPIGLAARDTLRTEMGYCLYGNDIDDTTTPLEAGLGWITKFNKEFTAKSLLEEQKAKGVERKLVGFEMIDRGIARHGYEIKDKDGNKIGYVTSGTQSPSLNKAIGMGYVSKEFSDLGTSIFISVRDKLVEAKIVKMPFEVSAVKFSKAVIV